MKLITLLLSSLLLSALHHVLVEPIGVRVGSLVHEVDQNAPLRQFVQMVSASFRPACILVLFSHKDIHLLQSVLDDRVRSFLVLFNLLMRLLLQRPPLVLCFARWLGLVSRNFTQLLSELLNYGDFHRFVWLHFVPQVLLSDVHAITLAWG